MNEAEYLLICLGEECAEVQQAISKVLRFGPENYHPNGGPTNIDELTRELTDLVAVAGILTRNGIVARFFNAAAIDAKQDKVLRYMARSKELGIVGESRGLADEH